MQHDLASCVFQSVSFECVMTLQVSFIKLTIAVPSGVLTRLHSTNEGGMDRVIDTC